MPAAGSRTERLPLCLPCRCAPVAPAGLVAIEPVHVFDSRLGGAIEAGATASVDVSAVVPPDAVAAMLQVTVDRTIGAGIVSVVDCADSRPTTSGRELRRRGRRQRPGRSPASSAEACASSSAPGRI